MQAGNVDAMSAALSKLKGELEEHDATLFEKMAADLFSRLVGDIGVAVAKPGSQFGGDAGTAGLRGRRLRIECKRYMETTKLDPRGLAGEVMEAVLKDELLEAWVLAATKQVSENEQNLARDAGARLGVPIVVVDWTAPAAGVGLNRLAALCATWPDVVEQHLGKAAAEASRALGPHVGGTVDNLRRDLEHWHIGFERLRVASQRQLERVWEDRAESKAALNQDAAGGTTGTHLIKRVQPLQQLAQWWQQPSDARTPAVIAGIEGVGKTWVALDWTIRSLDSLPVVVLLGASEFAGGASLSVAGVKDLVARTLRTMTRSPLGDAYWRERVRALLARPASEGAALLLVVDGLNQQPHVDWSQLAQALQGDEMAGRVRLLATARKHYFEVDLRRLGGLHAKPVRVEVGPYSNTEFDELLLLHGMGRKDLSPALLTLACTPRLFPLVLRLKDNVALQSDASVPRLLFEYGRDVLQLRQNSTLNEDDWVSWLIERATEYRQRLQAATGNRDRLATLSDLAATLAAPHLSEQDVARRLSDVIDGGFYRAVNSTLGARHVLEERHAILGLGLALLDTLGQLNEPNLADMQSALEAWLEPVAAIDQVVGVVHAALAVLSVLPDQDGSVATDALLVAWMNAQNPSAGFIRDVGVFGAAFPRSMLTVVEQSTWRSRSASFHHSTQCLRRLPRSRSEDWAAITDKMLQWCGQVNLPDKDKVADPQHYAGRYQTRLLLRIGTAEPGPLVVLGEELRLAYSYSGDAARAVPSILEGHEISDFMRVFRRAAVREAVQVEFRGDCWAGLRWLVALASRDEARAHVALEGLAREVLQASAEPGIHVRLRNRVSALLLRATGVESLEIEARSIDESFEEGWCYETDYLNDPANSLFALEFRHAQGVLSNASIPAGRRLDRLGSLLGHPLVKLPQDLLDAVKGTWQQQSFDNVDAIGQTTKEDLDVERIELFAARFAPAEFASTTRRRLRELASRTGDSKYWAALASSEMLLPAGPAECNEFGGLRTRSKLVTHEHIANSWCLQMELLHKQLPEQLSLLLVAQDYHFLHDLMATVRTATAQQLLDFLEANAAARVRAARIVLAVMADQIPVDADALSQSLIEYLSSDVEDMRSLAIAALSSCAPEVCGRALMADNWATANVEPFLAHHGSSAVAAATVHLGLTDVLPAIAPWRWLDAAIVRGGESSELEECSAALLTVLRASPGTIPAFDGLLTVKVLRGEGLPRVTVQERQPRDGDIKSALGRLNESTEDADRRWQELAKRAAASIQRVRAGGNALYLHSFSKESVNAAYCAAPALWQRALDGIDEVSADFLARLHAAEGLYLTYCEVLLEREPGLGAKLWRVLRDNLSLLYHGAAGVPELIHIPFRATDSVHVLALREEIASIERCNTDSELLDLVITAQLNGRVSWLDGFIATDSADDAPERVNDFAAPGVMNLLCRSMMFSGC